MKARSLFIVLAVLLVLASLILWPRIDLLVTGWFYTPAAGFFLADYPLFIALHGLAYYGARLLGIALILGTLITALRRKALWNINSKGWLFLFLALIIGPVLIANIVLKDHWGRARPRQVAAFGGSAEFSPPWIPQLHHHRNDSFVAGDPAFGFYLTSFAYLVPLPKNRKKPNPSRRFFWGGMAVGAVLGMVRIMMGAHFFSDVIFAAFFMLATSAGLHAIMYGPKATAIHWRNWLFRDGKKTVTPG